jgi:HSP20 family protein
MPYLPPAAPMRLFGDELDDLMIRLFSDPEARVLAPLETKWAPHLDVEETPTEMIVKVDLPGIEPRDVVIEVADGVLILHGERKEEREEKGRNFHRTERFVGEFYRALPLPRGIDPEKIVARSLRGVVTVTIPRKPEVLPRKIAVEPEPTPEDATRSGGA